MTVQGLSLLIVLMGILITYWSLRRAPQQFYSDTPWLWPWGVFVWGDGLVMGPLWVLLGVLFWWLSWIEIVRVVCLVVTFRSVFEVIYWLNHQVAQRSYLPPLFRRVKWIGPQEAAILYQLLNMSQAIIALTVFMLTWR